MNIRIVDHALLFKQDKSKMPPFKIFHKQCESKFTSKCETLTVFWSCPAVTNISSVQDNSSLRMTLTSADLSTGQCCLALLTVPEGLTWGGRQYHLPSSVAQRPDWLFVQNIPQSSGLDKHAQTSSILQHRLWLSFRHPKNRMRLFKKIKK